jgi:hypothetical protein
MNGFQVINVTVFKLNMKSIIVVPIFLTLLICSTGQTSNGTTRFKKEIPTWKNNEPDLFYKLTQQKVKQLKIDSLQSGYDSLQIRVWYEYSLITLRNLLIIKRTNSTWTVTKYTMTVDWNPNNLTEKVKVQRAENLNPKSGWNSFLNKLFALQIMTLPNMDNIPGLVDGWTDGISYNIEIATKKQYRFYSYHLPEEFQDKYWQAKNMVEILKIVETEIGIASGIR